MVTGMVLEVLGPRKQKTPLSIIGAIGRSAFPSSSLGSAPSQEVKQYLGAIGRPMDIRCPATPKARAVGAVGAVGG